jgi:hypothetical protein
MQRCRLFLLYIIMVDTLSNIRNIEVYNGKGELQSDLINDSACWEYDFEILK